jgi:predicted nucleotidyltransferase
VAQIRSRITEIISRYRRELVRSGIDVKAVYLYGSCASGLNHEGSDIDLIIVSSDFEQMNLRERLEKLGVASAHVMEPVQAYGFTPDELKNPQLSSFWSNILEKEAVMA